MPYISRTTQRKKPTATEVSPAEVVQEQQDSASNFETILDYMGRPSRAGAGAINALAKGENPLKRILDNLGGYKKDDWATNIAEASGIDKDSYTAKGLGFVGDAALDPLNLIGGLGLVGKIGGPARKAIQGVQAASKAGTYGPKAKAVAVAAKKARGLVSNFAGLTPDEKAIVQLFDAKFHSLDDIAKEATIKKLDTLKGVTDPVRQAQGQMEAVEAGKRVYAAQLADARAGMQSAAASKFGANLSPELQEHVAKRLSKHKPSATERFAYSMSNSPYLAPDRAFKLQATRHNPLYYMNNLMGNVQQAVQEGTQESMRGYGDVLGSFARQYGRKLGMKTGSGVDGYTPEMLEALGKTRGVKTNVSALYRGKEGGGNIDKSLMNVLKVYADEVDPLKKSGTKEAGKTVSRFLDKQTQNVEGESRQAAFNAFFKQAKRKGMSESAAADDAALRVTQALFDYEDLTPALKVVRSAPIIGQPFVTWGIKNAPRQAAMVAKNPQYLGKLDALKRMSESTNDENYVPDYMRERMSLRLGKVGENTLFFNPAMAASDVNKIPTSASGAVNTVMDGMHPLGKMALELATNKDMFTQQNIADRDLPEGDRLFAPQRSTPPELRAILEEAPGLFGNLGPLSATRNQYSGKAEAPYIMKKAFEYFPASRNVVRGLHSITNNADATDKIPGIGPFIPFDLKSQQQLDTSRQFELKKAASRVKARRRKDAQKQNRLRAKTEYTNKKQESIGQRAKRIIGSLKDD